MGTGELEKDPAVSLHGGGGGRGREYEEGCNIVQHSDQVEPSVQQLLLRSWR